MKIWRSLYVLLKLATDLYLRGKVTISAWPLRMDVMKVLTRSPLAFLDVDGARVAFNLSALFASRRSRRTKHGAFLTSCTRCVNLITCYYQDVHWLHELTTVPAVFLWGQDVWFRSRNCRSKTDGHLQIACRISKVQVRSKWSASRSNRFTS